MMSSMVADIVPEIALLVAGVLVLLFALFAPRRHQWVAGLLAAGGALAAAALAWIRLRAGEQMVTFTGSYAIDHLTDWAILFTGAATVVVIALSVPWFRTDPRHGEYYTLLLFSALGAILLAGATDLIQLVLALLLSSVTGYVLAAYHRRSRSASEAGIKYFLLGALANTTMLLGVAFLFGLAGTSTYDGLGADLGPASPALVVGAALVLVALAFKLGAVPAHAWVPDVAQGAPAPAAAFITTAPKIGGLIALARFVAVLPEGAIGWRPLIAVLAAATMTLGNLAALWSDDLRRLLGWSAISQTGYGLMAVVALGRSDLDLVALLYFLLAYAIGNLAAFAVVVALRGRTGREDYRGLGRRRPWLAAILALAFLSFIGIPPLVGFPAKLLLFGVAIEAGYTWLSVLAIVNTVVSLFYYARFLAPIYFDQPAGRFPLLSPAASGAAVIVGSALIIAGVLTETFVGRFSSVLILFR